MRSAVRNVDRSRGTVERPRSTDSRAALLPLGRVFAGRFLPLRLIGSGGMGQVYLVREIGDGCEYALKRCTLLSERARRSGASEAIREFDLLARVSHPSIVAVHELGFAADGPFFTMEFVPGRPADQVVAAGDWRTIFVVASRAAEALEALHGCGIVHGDIKPSNVLVVAANRAVPTIKVVDFGLSSILEMPHRTQPGTPGYAAPELIAGEAASPSSDLYGLGALLYHLVAGRPAFVAADHAALVVLQRRGAPSPRFLHERGAPAGLIGLVMALLSSEPGNRPADAREVRRELGRLCPEAAGSLSERLATAQLVGRERELATLTQALTDAVVGSRIALVTGEAGAGKSAMLSAMAVRAAVQRHAVIQLSGSGTGADLGGRLLHRLACAAGAALTEAGDPSLESALAGLRAAGANGQAPLVLIDDYHRLDSATRHLVRSAALHPQCPPSLWILAGASGTEVTEGEQLLVASGLARHLPLRALSQTAIARLSALRLGHAAPTSLIAHVWQQAHGHPGTTIELLRSAVRVGALIESEDGIAVDAGSLPAATTGGGVESAADTLSALPAPARAAAEALAACGGAARRELIEHVLSMQAGEALGMLRAAGIAVESEELEIQLAPHALANHLRTRLPAHRRQELHRRALEFPGLSARERFEHAVGGCDLPAALDAAASALGPERAFDPDLARRAAALAEAADPLQAVAWYRRLGDWCFEAGQYADAVEPLGRAVELTRSPRERLSLLERLARARFRAGGLVEARELVSACLREPLDTALRSRFLTTLAALESAVGAHEQELSAAKEAVTLGSQSADAEAEGHAALTLAAAHLHRGELDAAQSAAERAERAFRLKGKGPGSARALVALGNVARARGDGIAAERCYRWALARARAHGFRLPLSEALANLGVVLTQSGRWSALRPLYLEARRVAVEDNRPAAAALALGNLSLTHGLLGYPHPARRCARAALRLARAHAPAYESFAWRALAQAHRIAGRLVMAERGARRALAVAVRRGDDEEIRWCRVELGHVLAEKEEWSQLGSLCGVDAAADLPASAAEAMLGCLAGRAALYRNLVGPATSTLRQLQAWLAMHDAPHVRAHVYQLEAEIHLWQGSIPRGLARAGRSLEIWHALSARAQRAKAIVSFAALAVRAEANDRAPIRPWLELAIETFRALESHLELERAQALLIEWLKRAPTRHAAAADERQLMEQVWRLFHAIQDLPELGARAMELLVLQLQAESGVLLLSGAEPGTFTVLAEHGAVDRRMRRRACSYSRRIVRQALESGEGLVVRDARSDPRALSESVRDLDLRAIVCAPIFSGGRPLGAVYVDDSRRAHAFDDSDRALLESFAQCMAVAIGASRDHAATVQARNRLEHENKALRRELGSRYRPEDLIGTSPAMNKVMATIERVASASATVLLRGETGTGKELAAHVIHHLSPRRDKPFVAVSCAAVTDSLQESEFFGVGHRRATGVDGHHGHFLNANGGTLFLDEIHEMPPTLQAALLRALSAREVVPVGTSRPVRVDVRLVVATSEDLAERVREGRFSRPLFERLNVVTIEMPPLRQRKGDIPALAKHMVALVCAQDRRAVASMAPEFLAALARSNWPGNVRGLLNYITRIVALTPGSTLYPDPLPDDLQHQALVPRTRGVRRLSDLLAAFERQVLADALERHHGVQSRAARELGLSETNMRYRLRRNGLIAPRDRQN
ncbi:MAG TPA: sigma 54-interacting transcriptional regulator [Gemmatimonadales bacterium]|nr:sigma 54-interacting transcriptional regulator [Gemmatimonadales bacterium]